MITNNERVDSLFVAIQEALDGKMPSVWTALPGIVQSFNAVAGTCTVQPAVQVQVTDKDGAKKFVSLPILVDVPVQFVGGGSYVLTMPVKKDDEGLIIFSCRCIDAWWQNGGVQPQAELRLHDLSDGFLIPGFRSQARKLSNVNADFPELRSVDGTVKLTATAVGFKVTGTFEVAGDFLLSGNIKAPAGATYAGNIATTGEITRGVGTADQVTVGHHTHTANGQPPTPGT